MRRMCLHVAQRFVRLLCKGIRAGRMSRAERTCLYALGADEAEADATDAHFCSSVGRSAPQRLARTASSRSSSSAWTSADAASLRAVLLVLDLPLVTLTPVTSVVDADAGADAAPSALLE